MSWLSKALGGNTVKIAAVAASAYFGKQFVWGETTPVYGGNLKGFGRVGTKYTEDTFAGRMFNKAGITPFQNTRVGSFLSPVTEFLRPRSMGGTGLAEQAADKLSYQDRMDAMPSAGTITSSPIRSDTNFGLGQVSQLPIGSGGQVGRALESEQLRLYMARRVKAMGLPSIQGLPSATSIASAELGKTTSSRKRAYKAYTQG